uniref:Putative secreted protein n=1 Tax=Anopheles marajoara TaxID=58244 RepID=A0A2M4C797_9DIPT
MHCLTLVSALHCSCVSSVKSMTYCPVLPSMLKHVDISSAFCAMHSFRCSSFSLNTTSPSLWHARSKASGILCRSTSPISKPATSTHGCITISDPARQEASVRPFEQYFEKNASRVALVSRP